MQSKYNEKSKIQLETIKNNSKLILKSCDKMIENIVDGKLLAKKMTYNNNNNYQNCTTPINNDEKPNILIKILDIGSSHGRNSITPLNLIISNILKKYSKQQCCFEVYHEDIAENDFTKLFLEISNNSNSYIKLSDQIYYYAIGNSFYNQVVPSETMDYIFSFSSSHWSKYNSEIFYNPNSIVMMYLERSKQYSDHCKDCLYKNFSSRAKELKQGGIFIITIICESQDLTAENDTLYKYFTCMKSIWKSMANDNLLSMECVDKMILPINFYKHSEVMDTIKKVESDHHLKLVTFEKHTQIFHGINDNDVDQLTESQKSELLFSYINAACEPTIKTFLPGDSNSKNLLYKVFKIKFLRFIKLNYLKIDNLFNYYSLMFEKDINLNNKK